jgi:hypothetical protein
MKTEIRIDEAMQHKLQQKFIDNKLLMYLEMLKEPEQATHHPDLANKVLQLAVSAWENKRIIPYEFLEYIFNGFELFLEQSNDINNLETALKLNGKCSYLYERIYLDEATKTFVQGFHKGLLEGKADKNNKVEEKYRNESLKKIHFPYLSKIYHDSNDLNLNQDQCIQFFHKQFPAKKYGILMGYTRGYSGKNEDICRERLIEFLMQALSKGKTVAGDHIKKYSLLVHLRKIKQLDELAVFPGKKTDQ